MNERLIDVAKSGNIEELYNLIQQDPYVLDKVDQVPFMQTPLHVAISAKQTCLAKEIANLKPSFARKLNQCGYSPLHLAAASGEVEMVKEFLGVDPNLCLIKGREKRTPLHYAATAGHIDIINLLLDACPRSIVELTIKKETAIHLAVRSHQLEAVELLLKWLGKVYDIEIDASAFLVSIETLKLLSLRAGLKMNGLLNKEELVNVLFSHAFDKREVEDFATTKNSLRKIKMEEVLNWKDNEGNTVLHLAMLTMNCEMIKLLLGSNSSSRIPVDVNAINSNNLTALDIFSQLRKEERNKEIESILHDAGAVSASQIITMAPPLDTLTSNKTFQLIGRTPPNDLTNNMILIAAILLAIACFLTGVYPPGGLWQANYRPGYNTTTTEYTAGTAIMATSYTYRLFMFCNLFGFFVALLMISLLTMRSPLRWLLRFVLVKVSLAYLLALALIMPDENFPSLATIFLSLSIIFFFPLVTEAWVNYRTYKELQATNGEDRVKGMLIPNSYDGSKI